MIRLRALLPLVLAAGCTTQAAVPPAGTGAPTIVSLNPCTDGILAEVADPAQLLAISHYSHDARSTSMDLRRARRFRATGGTVEEMLALRPDVVVASSFMPPATRAALADLGIRVETVGIAATIADSNAQIRRLAALTGNPERGDVLISRIETAVTAMAPPPGSNSKSVVLWQPDGIVPGRGTLISQLLRRAGFSSHSAAMGLGQADYLGLEHVLASPPQVLLVAGRDRAQHHPSLAAVPKMRIAKFDPSLLYCGGPTIIRAAERLKAVREGRT